MAYILEVEEINGEPNSFNGYYNFSGKNNKDMKIKDKKNHKISESDLKVGDIIKVTGKKDKIKIAIGYSVEPLYNIKSVKILGQDLEGAVDTDIFNRADNVSFMVNDFTKKGITINGAFIM